VSGRIVRDGTLDRWIAGLEDFDKPDERDKAAWGQATEVFFGRTQEAVHVITAALKASGREEVYRTGSEIVGVVSYGGPEAPYAKYEFRRGGSHDALRRGFERTDRIYQATLAEIMRAKVERWE
jgi:hypothetical protein